MRKIGIISKKYSKESIYILREFLPWLRKRDCEVFLDDDSANILNINGYKQLEIPLNADMIVAFGGDGTMLSVSRIAANKGIPILGVNLGGLGFITEINKESLFDAMDKILSNDFTIEERMMLTVHIYRQNEEISTHTVLNDVVINKGALARIIDIETFIEQKYVTTFKSDGLIISTPTGSTAYSLSAGGPILYPSINCVVLTPICSHTLTNRPIVIDENMLIKLVLKSQSEDVYLTFDGQVGFSLMQYDEIEIVKSDLITRLILPYERDYFNILREKLKWGER